MSTANDAMTGAPRRVTRTAGISLALPALAAVCLLSLAIGTKSIPLATVVDSLLHPTDSQDSVIVTDLRLPRTILGILVGAALGLAGALMQGLTRNPSPIPACSASTRARRRASSSRSACWA
jgi:iron complex transport system permease protein